MIQSDNAPVSYVVKMGFLLNIGEASSKLSFKVAPGDILEFDGVNVHVQGVKGSAPSLKASLRLGWIEEAPVAKKTPSAKAKSAVSAAAPASPKDLKTDVGAKDFDIEAIAQKIPAPSKPVQSSAPSRNSKVTTSDEQIVSSTRAGKGSENQEAVQSQATKPSTRATVEKDEGVTIDAVRARTGAASPGKAEFMATKKAAEQKAVQSSAPGTRAKVVVVNDGDDVILTSERSKKAATKNAALTLDGTASIVDEYGEVSPEAQRQAEAKSAKAKENGTVESSDPTARAAGQGGRATPSSPNNTGKKAVEAQTVDAVYKGHRATPAVTNLEVNNETNADAVPKPIRKEAELVVLRQKVAKVDEGEGVEVSKTRTSKESTSEGAITSKVSVSSNNDISVPEAKSYNTSESVVMGKKASVTAVEESIYDPEDSLGLKGNSLVQKKDVSVIDLDTPEVPEEDFSYLNEDVDLEAVLAPPPPPSVDESAVSDNFLSTLIVEGSSWEKAKFFTKIKYINKCTNLSILGLISKDSSLQPSVKKVLSDRIELLSKAAPARVRK